MLFHFNNKLLNKYDNDYYKNGPKRKKEFPFWVY